MYANGKVFKNFTHVFWGLLSPGGEVEMAISSGGLYGKVPHETGAFFRLEVYKTVGIHMVVKRKGEADNHILSLSKCLGQIHKRVYSKCSLLFSRIYS